MKLQITTNAAHLARLMQRANTRAVRQATARSLNEIARGARADSAKEIRKEANLKARTIKAGIAQGNARSTDPVDKQAAVLAYSRKPIPLIEFDAREKIISRTLRGYAIRGVTVKVKKTRKVVRDGFLARLASGHRGVFKREPGTGRRVKVSIAPYTRTSDKRVVRAHWHQLPIGEAFGPTVGDIAGNRPVQARLEAHVRTRYGQVFARNLRYYLGK